MLEYPSKRSLGGSTTEHGKLIKLKVEFVFLYLRYAELKCVGVVSSP